MAETTGKPGAKLSWRETYKAMAAAEEDWSDLDVATADGFRSSAAGKPAEIAVDQIGTLSKQRPFSSSPESRR